MNYDWKTDLRTDSRMSATLLPPALFEETAWDILLALHSDEGCMLSLGKLGSVVSARPSVLNQWLSLLEDEQLITGEMHGVEQELRAVLTAAGRDRLDRYLSAASGLHVGAHP